MMVILAFFTRTVFLAIVFATPKDNIMLLGDTELGNKVKTLVSVRGPVSGTSHQRRTEGNGRNVARRPGAPCTQRQG